MILTEPRIDLTDLARDSGWQAKPEGLCKGAVCVPLPVGAVDADGLVDAHVVADRLRMALVHDADAGLWALGPESGGHALTTVEAPEFELPDLRTGEPFRLSSLRGSKVVVVSWASW